MKKKLKRAMTLGIGAIFILLGIVGLFLPVLQGILFLVIGLVILSKESKTAHRLLERWKERHPQIHTQAAEWIKRIRRRFGFTVRE